MYTIKQAYMVPKVEVFYLRNSLSLLVSVSTEAGFEEFEEGEEL